MNEAIKFINNIDGQIVAKTNIGASGSGVRILKTSTQKLDYIKSTFAGKGAPQRSGPNLGKGGVLKRGFKYILHPKGISKKLKTYRVLNQNKQKGFVIFQEYIPHEFEWRVVRIGDSYFAHKKLKLGDKASGTLIKRYDSPPLMLLDFVKELTDKYKFYSLAVDIFEYNGKYLVNEMQCIFGQSDAYQMKVDGKIGRYFHENNNWVFEEGDFCENECFNLRIKFIENILDNS
jgi:glutathione synthase/RimK-type ligase-like ATP-grasp enzyme